LGLGLVSLVNMFDPEVLVIYGEGIQLGNAYLAPMHKVLKERAFNGIAQSLRILLESGGNEIWARGAACVVLSSLFTSHEYQQKLPVSSSGASAPNIASGRAID
jgi:predicted NBD/HSP70 family sugar kinase